MKKVYSLLLILFVAVYGNAQIINIPDANFKAMLLYSSPTAGIGTNAQGNNITIDTNHDNEIELSEALTVYGLSVHGSIEAPITDLTALNYFSNLTFFNCTFNNLTDLSIVNTLPNLRALYFSFNSITSLDLTANPLLETVWCKDNNLTSLEIGNCLNLKNLLCDNNQLTSLATANLPNLESVQCSHNLLTELEITNKVNLYDLNCSHNLLTDLDLTGVGHPLATSFSNDFFLDCSFNDLSTLDTTVMNSGVKPRIDCAVNPNLISIYAKNGGVFMDDNPHTPPFPGLYFGASPNLSYICVDEFNFQYVQDKLTLQGYTNVTVDAACSLSNIDNSVADFKIYPVPVKTVLNFENNKMLEIKSVMVHNLLQQKVLESFQNSNQVDVANLSSGTYFINIQTDKGQYKSKFIKE